MNKPPAVILLSGFGTSKLYCVNKDDDTKRQIIWPIQKTVKSILKLVFSSYHQNKLKLTYDENDPINGKSTDTCDVELDWSENYDVNLVSEVEGHMTVFANIIENLTDLGMVNMKNAFSLVFDTRLRPGKRTETDFRNILQISEDNKNGKSVIVTYSYGGFHALHALSTMTEEEIKKKIGKLIFMACPFGGIEAIILTLLTVSKSRFTEKI
ncbi:hypothetical protein A3Q56_03267 [Intoshia linei]|uniref:Uncharacterized protein n=1 Tax=Intoshia linei TaxID=1819745 RepID=A0A177B419_9BILA|nr:hypothetical protein A3Q56_03267 [Intoshia linei]